MGSVIYNNLAALQSVNLNGKNMKMKNEAAGRVASGQRFSSAGGAAAEYQISERMKTQIRSLNQCTSNTDNGSDLLDVAMGALEQQTEILKKMRSLVMRASDGTYSEVDRKCIQRETDQMMDEFENIAVTTNFNGVRLLSRYTSEFPETFDFKFSPGAHLFDVNAEPAVDFFPAINSNDKWQDMTELEFSQDSVGESIGGSYTFNFLRPGFLPADMDFKDALNLKGFSMCCDGCQQFTTIVFDKSITAAESNYYSSTSNRGDALSDQNGIYSTCYQIGIADMSSPDDLYKTIFKGLCAAVKAEGYPAPVQSPASATEKYVEVSAKHDFQFFYDEATDQLRLEQGLGLSVRNGVRGLDKENYYEAYQGIPIQTGTKSNQQVDLKLPCTQLTEFFKEVPPEQLKVEPRKNALKFLSHIDWAIDYVLKGSTICGAQASRLEYTNANLVTAAENTTVAESTIRDADMAKEYTSFTKYNVLQQASQAMLAQANQSQQSVLSLLQ